MSDLDPLARTLVDAHRRAGAGGGGAAEGAADARAELVAALAGASGDEIGSALASAAGSAGLFKVRRMGVWRGTRAPAEATACGVFVHSVDEQKKTRARVPRQGRIHPPSAGWQAVAQGVYVMLAQAGGAKALNPLPLSSKFCFSFFSLRSPLRT